MNNKDKFQNYINLFLKQNSILNLISKNDEKYLWEKHIFDSLAIGKFFEKYKTSPLPLGEGRISTPEISSVRNSGEGLKLLDIGTGGGFPAVPISLEYPEIEVFALDSIRKKINAIEKIKEELDIQNLHPICDRAENILKTYPPLEGGSKSVISGRFDIITSRAVATLDKIALYALPLLNKDGYFIAYKSIRAHEEIKQAQTVLKKYKAEVIDIIEYDLPLTENHTRNLIVIKFT